MLTQNTGSHMLDSGGAYGRNWQRNQNKTLQDFKNEPQVAFENDGDGFYSYTISLFHYLMSDNIELDELCDSFNSLKCDNWDSEIYGVSEKQEKWIEKQGFEIGDSFNSYNGESNLSQIIQGTYLKLGVDNYVLLQIHGGCDARGGYTDAKLFYLPEDYMPSEYIYGDIDGKAISNIYDGNTLRYDEDEDGRQDLEIKPTKKSKVVLELANNN